MLCSIALSLLKGLTQKHMREIYDVYASAEEAFADLGRQYPPLSQALASGKNAAMEQAKRELDFCERHAIRILPLNDPDFPFLLRNCPDTPTLLYQKGNANLNRQHIVSVVGTRHVTEYGRLMCSEFCAELKRLVPDVLIVSGLAYGVDIVAHRAAVDCGADTIGVLAHGLDRIYPSMHRDTARQMIERGGALLTEYPTGTNPDKGNFVRRNRIVAGMAHATVVVESAKKGGALITARLALDYNREVAAFPGRATDEYSVGCNNLIRNNGAALITSAEDFAKLMEWETEQPKAVIRPSLFPELSEEEQAVCALLGNGEARGIAEMCAALNTPLYKLSATLFGLEMKNIINRIPGDRIVLQKKK